MAVETASLLVWLATLWIYAGAAVAVAFLLFGIDRVDENARGAYTFRPLLVPGISLLWPLVLWRWWALEADTGHSLQRYRPLRAAHGWVWLILAILIPAVLITALTIRQPAPQGDAAVPLEAPAQ